MIKLDVEKLKEKLKKLLEEKFVNKKTYTVADVYKEAGNLFKEEMRGLKKNELSAAEAVKMEKLARLLAKNVLKEMDVV